MRRIRICDARNRVELNSYSLSGEVAVAKIKFTFSFFNIRLLQDALFLKGAPTVPTTAPTVMIDYKNKILSKNAGIDAELGSIAIIHERQKKSKTITKEEILKEYVAIYDRVSDYYEMVVVLAKMKSSPISTKIREELDDLRRRISTVDDFIKELTKLWKKTIDALKVVIDYNAAVKNFDPFSKPDKKVTIEPGFYDLTMNKTRFGDLMKFDPKTARIEIGNQTYPKYLIRPFVSVATESHGDLFDIIGGKFPDVLCKYKKINVHLEQLDFDATVSVDESGKCKRDRLLYSVDVVPVNGRFFGEQVMYKPERLDFLPLRDGAHNELSFYFTDSCGDAINMKSEVSLELEVR